MSNNQKGFLFAFLATFLSSIFPLAFRELGRLHEWLLSVLALVIVSLFISFVPMAMKPSRLNLPKKTWLVIILVGTTSLLGNGFYMQSLQMLEPAISLTIQRTELIFVAILGAVFFAEKITIAVVIAVVLSMVGLFFLQGGVFFINELLLHAIFITLLSSFSFALMLVFSKASLRYVGALTMNFYRLLFMALLLILWLDIERLKDLTAYAWMLVIISAICGPVGARYFITSSLRYIPMGTALLYTMMAPVMTACWQWFLWGTTLHSTEVIGALMILLGVMFTLLKDFDVTNNLKKLFFLVEK